MMWGPACALRKCPASDNILVRGTTASACTGRGQCNSETGQCYCGSHYGGLWCENHKCDGGCGGGTCDVKSGQCRCSQQRSGRDCRYQTCAADCTTTSNICDRLTGTCTCLPDGQGCYGNGARCVARGRTGSVDVDWTMSMDKWGWSLCPEGTLLIGMARGPGASLEEVGDALFSLEKARCAKPSEAHGSAIPLASCYHENWWSKFNSAGSAYCQQNFYIAGLFRSHCNSLYCIEMVKCCAVKHSLWTDCKSTPTARWKQAGVFAEVSSPQAFITGFQRTNLHTLDGLTELHQCEPWFFGNFDAAKDEERSLD